MEETSCMKSNIKIGIDFGTTYCCVTMYDGKNITIIPNEYNNKITPSYVYIKDKTVIIGEKAKENAKLYPKNTIYDVKRFLGQPNDIIRKLSPFMAYDIKLVDNNYIIDINGVHFTFIQIAALILNKLKLLAENYLNCIVKDIIVTVPAYFNNIQRKSIMMACELCKLNVLRVLNEPTAAAIAYGYNCDNNDKNILVYDLGGGTLDISILNISNNIFTVCGNYGDGYLGGEDFDNILLIHCLKTFAKLFPKIDKQKFIKDPNVLKKLKISCEIAKKELSYNEMSTIKIKNLYDNINFKITITKKIFEQLCLNLFKRCLEPLPIILKEVYMDIEDIDDVILVGGSTRIPKIKEILWKYFNIEPKSDINPDEAVAYGAGVQSYMISNKNDDNIILIDVSPRSLGVETNGGIMEVLIKKNTPIPCKYEKVFSTVTDNQPSILINIYEGERKFVKDNILLGNIKLTDIPKLKKGIPKFNIMFRIDVNGILYIEVIDPNGSKKNIIMEYSDNFEIGDVDDYLADDKIIEKHKTVNKIIDYISAMKNHFNQLKIQLLINDETFYDIMELLNVSDKFINSSDKINIEELNIYFKHLKDTVNSFL